MADSNDYEYEANGNLQTDGTFWYIYNDANQLYEVREGGAGGDLVSRYLYNHEGRRTIKKEYTGGALVNSTYYVGRDYEVQLYNDETHNVTYYQANGELAARKEGDSTFYYHNDHLTGTNLVTNNGGTVDERMRYYPFGSMLKGGDSKYTYTGQESDKETGLMYYGARYYNPEIRRFTSPDPS
ncbi:MAG: RHS repeat-associated core domain-containing protein, partial [Candidatus Altiarchaeota archaeon]